MIHAFFPEKDSTIYEIAPNRNVGLDEVLELQKQTYNVGGTSSYYESRVLIKFNQNEINSFISTNNVNIDDSQFLLNFYIAGQSELPFDYIIEAYPVSGSWTNGTGRRYGQQVSDGVTWKSTNGSTLTSSYWSTESISLNKAWYNEEPGGGNWYTSSICSASFSYESKADLQINVTDQIKNWYNNVIPNEGFILRFESSSFIQESFPNTNISYFGMNTKTIYSPQLHVLWNTGSYNSGSLTTMKFIDNPIVYIKNFKSEYKQNLKHRIYIGTRPKYPRPTFTQNNEYAVNKILPKSSYYQILDAHTMEAVIPYSEYTKISGNSDGSYFDFWSSPLYPERWYKFEFKVIYEDSIEYYTNNEYTFKVID